MKVLSKGQYVCYKKAVSTLEQKLMCLKRRSKSQGNSGSDWKANTHMCKYENMPVDLNSL